MMSKVFAYLDHIFPHGSSASAVVHDIDGVAPRAKMNQQRSRRFRSALEAQKAREEAARKGEPEPSGEPFDSNCITPGTPFMWRASPSTSEFYVLKKQTEDRWQRTTVILSGHEVRGEGEHKIMEHSHGRAKTRVGSQPDAPPVRARRRPHHARARHPRASLLSVERGGQVRGGRQRGQPSREDAANPTDDGILLLHVGLLREYLDQEFRGIADAVAFSVRIANASSTISCSSACWSGTILAPLPTLTSRKGR